MAGRAAVYFGEIGEGYVLFVNDAIRVYTDNIQLENAFKRTLRYTEDEKTLRGIFIWEGYRNKFTYEWKGELRRATDAEASAVMAGLNPFIEEELSVSEPLQTVEHYKQRCEYLEKKFAELFEAVNKGTHE